jgi:hypothetical protein
LRQTLVTLLRAPTILHDRCRASSVKFLNGEGFGLAFCFFQLLFLVSSDLETGEEFYGCSLS